VKKEGASGNCHMRLAWRDEDDRENQNVRGPASGGRKMTLGSRPQTLRIKANGLGELHSAGRDKSRKKRLWNSHRGKAILQKIF